VQDIGVHGAIKKVVVTSVMMRPFLIVPGAQRSLSEISDRHEDVRV